jgi:hypothetical protein
MTYAVVSGRFATLFQTNNETAEKISASRAAADTFEIMLGFIDYRPAKLR